MTDKQIEYDLVITGGRVIDPETGLDAVRNVGIKGDKIAVVTEKPIQGKETIDATGLLGNCFRREARKRAVGPDQGLGKRGLSNLSQLGSSATAGSVVDRVQFG